MNLLTIVALVFPFLVLLASSFGEATLSRGDKKKKSNKVKQPASNENVVTRGVAVDKVKVADIIKEHAAYNDAERGIKQFNGDTLAYVTPWNNHGYDVAKIFSQKFTYVSPVWLQIVRQGGQYVIQGTHDIDQGWVSEVRKGGARLVPRVLFDGWTGHDFHILLTSEDEQRDCISALLQIIKKYTFDGLVLEVWSQFGQHRHSELLHFLGHVYESFQENQVKLIVVIPPPIYPGTTRDTGIVSPDDFKGLAAVTDATSLMTYDHSNAANPGPNSPVDWIRRNVEFLCPDSSSPNRKKILLGLNFYGNDYLMPRGGGPIIGKQYIELLSKLKPKILWNEDFSEHVIKYRGSDGEHEVYYPTLKSISVRLKLARELRVGISIWEIGQGLDYFYDLL